MKEVSFLEKQKAVVKYIQNAMLEQGVSEMDAIGATTKVYFFSSDNINNLYACINSSLDETVIKAIVAHDYNGLAGDKEAFLPKSVQFAK